MSTDTPEPYDLDGRDRALLAAAGNLLKKLTAAEILRPAELVSVAKVLHVLSSLPRVTPGLDVAIQVGGPRRKFGEIETRHWWEVAVDDESLFIKSGAHFYRPSTGGDTFTTMNWAAVPGLPAEFDDYREGLAIVPDVQTFPDGVATIDFASGAYSIEITDPDNPLLEDTEDADEEPSPAGNAPPLEGEDDEESETDADPQGMWSVIPVDAAEKRLTSTVVEAEVDANAPQHSYGVQKCDFCGCSLTSRGVFVDGRLRDELMWGNMCANCFEDRGAGIGWGVGQLYARQPNGDWLMVAGFPREEPL